jgi:hypothetical protein
MLNRREFVSMLAAASAALKAESSFAGVHASQVPGSGLLESLGKSQGDAGEGFPISDYTPFGYLDNPWHTWNMHQSGVFRSLPGIGFGLYYPAGPGGYFDYHRNGVYVAELALGFRIGQRVLLGAEDFHPGQLTSPHHSKNIFSYSFQEEGTIVDCSYLQVNEDALAVHVKVRDVAGRGQTVQMLASHTYRLGGSQWWGGDGLAGDFDEGADTLWMRSFAAGTVFALAADRRSACHFFSTHDEDRRTWLDPNAKSAEKLSYYPQPLHGGVRYDLTLEPHGQAEMRIVMARGANPPAVLSHAHVSLKATEDAMNKKRMEDAAFWTEAPRLTGDWPKHWRHGWIYDFETLRTMVRRSIGVYKHPWDAMQIQAPRNVLAETSIDMWALSYANPESAKEVFLGQFLDAVDENIPCMREDGVMNMVAADGSECGTSISWCFPFFCAESIYNRTHDLAWLRLLYPRLCALLRWTLAHRVDSGGFVVGKCSWETGMDASKRFQIQQQTGGELVEFLRLVELQAAASKAGAILSRFAKLVSDVKSVPEWQRIERTYSEKTQQLWKNDWFHDFDTRTMQLVNTGERDPSQAAPAFCDIATEEQKKLIAPTLRKMFETMQAQKQIEASSADDALNWSSFVLPFLESAWSSGDKELASMTVEAICDRIYTSMDRRSIDDASSDAKRPRLGWPGVSCEIWGAHGAFGGEVYGWGAVMPAHIVRNLIGFRESEDAEQFVLSPGFGPLLAGAGKQYGIAGLPYVQQRISVQFTFLDARSLEFEITAPESVRILSVTDAAGQGVVPERSGTSWRFKGANYESYLVKASGFARQ